MEALLLVIVMFWLPLWALRRELESRHTPAYWRRWGAVVVQPKVLQLREGPIGSYMGAEIFEHVRFCNCDYCFDHVVPREERDFIGGGELYLEPGLVYRMEERVTSRRS